ncbi:MAG: plastocyanin/azurin family copper-binding protein [Vicinamibacterales bacterium]|nr:plastocyanin/azurin family copper-binding protein [Vicinamibacterales bacterium]
MTDADAGRGAPRGLSTRRVLCHVGLVALLVAAVAGCSQPPVAEEAAPAEATEVRPGSGEVVAVRGAAPPVAGGFRSVVFFTPEDGHEVALPDEPPTMDQFGLTFDPGVLVARAGQAVAFTNGDDVLHNVHVSDSATRETVFNIATPIAGVYMHTFEQPGTYTVSCDVHPAMAAYIVVTAAPYAAVADRAGRFELSGVPAGSYRATVWSVDATWRSEQQVEISADVELQLHSAS